MVPGEGLSIWRFTSKLFRFRFRTIRRMFDGGVHCVFICKEDVYEFVYELFLWDHL